MKGGDKKGRASVHMESCLLWLNLFADLLRFLDSYLEDLKEDDFKI